MQYTRDFDCISRSIDFVYRLAVRIDYSRTAVDSRSQPVTFVPPRVPHYRCVTRPAGHQLISVYICTVCNYTCMVLDVMPFLLNSASRTSPSQHFFVTF